MGKYNRAANINGVKKKMKGEFLINQPFEFTEKQTEVIDTIMDESTKCVFINGSAGTGKTHLAVFSALQHIQLKLADRLIYVRGMVESANSKLGFLPGDQKAKTDVYFEVMRSKLEEMLSATEITSLETAKTIQAMPISFLRGRDFKNSVVIVDEAQCLYFEELETIISRIGEDSKIIFLFDPDQSDITNAKHRRDIVKFSKIFNTPEADEFGIAYREFTEDDIMRSEFCKFVMKAIKKYKMFDAG